MTVPCEIVKTGKYGTETEILDNTYDGLVVEISEFYGSQATYKYAHIWDTVLEAPRMLTYQIIAGSWGNEHYIGKTGTLKIDAPAGIVEKYNIYKRNQDRLRYNVNEFNRAKKPEKGKTVKVIRGRKAPKGTVGTIFWVGDKGWGMTAGLKDEQGTVYWVLVEYLEVLNPERYANIRRSYD